MNLLYEQNNEQNHGDMMSPQPGTESGLLEVEKHSQLQQRKLRLPILHRLLLVGKCSQRWCSWMLRNKKSVYHCTVVWTPTYRTEHDKVFRF